MLPFVGALLALGLVLGDRAPLVEHTTAAPCDVGERPGYFVPSPPNSRLALLGCARLGVGGKRVEFSGHRARIGGDVHLCIDSAFSGRGRRGFYIPSVCGLHPPASRFAVRYAAQPRQGVRGYAFVIWGTARASTSRVVARFGGATARAAVFKVRSRLARTLGQPAFSLFVVELPLAAACTRVVVRASGPDATDRLRRRPRLCART